VVYVLGRRFGLYPRYILWASTECGGGVAGVSGVSKQLKVDSLRVVAVEVETRTSL
jgi:hypothetical protein